LTISRQAVDALIPARRILVLGPCGSGKTCLTRNLSLILGLPAVHLDARFWHPGWVSTPQSEWRGVVRHLIQQDSWIMDGTYESTLDLRIPAAEVIIMLNCTRWASLWGVVSRSLAYRNKPRPDAPPDQPIDLAYLKYIWRYPVRTDTLVRGLIETHGPQIPVIKLDGRNIACELLSALQAARAGQQNTALANP
jgi:adenylate kinase family enzyme